MNWVTKYHIICPPDIFTPSVFLSLLFLGGGVHSVPQVVVISLSSKLQYGRLSLENQG